MLDDGRLTDNKGRTVDFSNALIIFTSNVGSRKILGLGQQQRDGEAAYAQMRSAVKTELGSTFRPEFLNRLDELIVFGALGEEEVARIAGLMLNDLTSRCAEQGLELTVTPKLTRALVEKGFSAAYGARPLRRAVQRLCEDPVAEALLGKFVREGEAATLDAAGADAVAITNARGERRVQEVSAGQGIEEEDEQQQQAPPPGEPAAQQATETEVTIRPKKKSRFKFW